LLRLRALRRLGILLNGRIGVADGRGRRRRRRNNARSLLRLRRHQRAYQSENAEGT
jgi:hypothetical protein